MHPARQSASAKELRSTLEMLLGRTVTVAHARRPRPGTPAASDPQAPQDVIATFLDPQDEIRWCITLEFNLAVVFAASLSMLPANRLGALYQRRAMPRELHENLHEVMNICSSVFSIKVAGRSVRVLIDRVYLPPREPDPAVMARLPKPAKAEEFEVEVAGYPSGKLTLIVL